MKKGISPLIGTVLLIGFTIGLAILIFSWGTKFGTELTEETGEKAKTQISCIYDVKVEISGGSVANNAVSFFIENKAEKDLSSYIVRLIKTDGTVIRKELSETIVGYDKKKIVIENITETITDIELVSAEGCAITGEKIPVVTS